MNIVFAAGAPSDFASEIAHTCYAVWEKLEKTAKYKKLSRAEWFE